MHSRLRRRQGGPGHRGRRSVGSELARPAHKLGPSKLVLLDRDESALHSVPLSLYGVGLLDTGDMVLCDIRDEDALAKVFETHGRDVVFHAAALKHPPMLERFPEQGWKTNVLGSLQVLPCAEAGGVANFVNISTDRAADASSVLGRTKRVAERLTAWYAQELGFPYVQCGSATSLPPAALCSMRSATQIERGGLITVTHPDITRYFMPIPEACELVLRAGGIGNRRRRGGPRYGRIDQDCPRRRAADRRLRQEHRGQVAAARLFSDGTSETLFRTGLSLPSGSVLRREYIDRVASAVYEFLSGGRLAS